MLSYQEHKRNLLVEEINNTKGLSSLPRAIDLLSFDLTNVCVVKEEIKTRTDLMNHVIFEGINTHFCQFLKTHNNNIKSTLESKIQEHEGKTQLMLEDNQDLSKVIASVEKDFDEFIQTIEKIDPVDYINQIKVIIQDMMQNVPDATTDTQAASPTPIVPPVNTGVPARTPVVPTSKFQSDIEPDEMGAANTPTFSPNASKPANANQGGWWNGIKKGLGGLRNMFIKYPMHKLKKFYRGAKDIWQGNFGEGASLAESIQFVENKLMDGFAKIQQIIMAFKDQLINQAKAYKARIIGNLKQQAVAPMAAPTTQPSATPASPTAPINPAPPTPTATASPTSPTTDDKDMSPLAVQGRVKRNISPESRAAGIGKRVADAYKKMTLFASMADAELLHYKDKLFQPGGIGLSKQYRDLADKFNKGVTENNFGEFKAALQKQLDLINRTSDYAPYIQEAKDKYGEFKQRAYALLKGHATDSQEQPAPTPTAQAPAQAPPEAPKPVPAAPVQSTTPVAKPEAPKPTPSVEPAQPVAPKTTTKPEKPVGQEQPQEKPLDPSSPNDMVIKKIKEMSLSGETAIRKGVYSTLNAGIIDQLTNTPREDRPMMFAQLLMQNLFGSEAESEYATELAEKIAAQDSVKDYFDIDPIPSRGTIAGELSSPLSELLSSFPLEKGLTPY